MYLGGHGQKLVWQVCSQVGTLINCISIMKFKFKKVKSFFNDCFGGCGQKWALS